jgi:hypothetical protein
MIIPIQSAKLALPFKAGALPSISPDNPRFTLDLSGVKIAGQVTAKAARKLAIWQGSAVLTGKLIATGGQLQLLDAGFQFIDPKPAEPAAETPAGGAP